MIDHFLVCNTHTAFFQWDVDSAAMGDYHTGQGPNERTLRTLKKFGITDYKHKVRQVLLLKDTMIKMCVLCFVSDFI
jgi:protein-tyrosine-phosphatase